MRFFARTLPFLIFPLLASCVQQGAVDSLNARVSRNEQQMQQLSSQMGNVEQVLPGQAEMWAQMQAMRQEINMLRGHMDEANAGGSGQNAQLASRLNRLETAVRQMASELGMQVEALNAPLETSAAQEGNAAPATGHAAAPAPAAPVETASPASAQPAASQDTASRLYDSGMSAFASRNYRDAVKAFTDFTKNFPKHKLASNAHFWRGESYYQLKDYAGAALAYQDVIEKFPGSGKFQSAMLKQGMSFYQAGKKDAAKLRLEELIKKYPQSPEAGRAKTFLQQNK